MFLSLYTYPGDIDPGEGLYCRWEGATQLADLDKEGLVTQCSVFRVM